MLAATDDALGQPQPAADTVYNYDVQWAEVSSSAGIRQARLRDLFQRTDLAISWSEDTVLARQNLLAAGIFLNL